MKIHQLFHRFQEKRCQTDGSDFASSYELCPGFGMNITPTFCQALGTLIAHFEFSSVITDDAISQSSVDGVIGSDCDYGSEIG
jgi:hypothetical protein